MYVCRCGGAQVCKRLQCHRPVCVGVVVCRCVSVYSVTGLCVGVVVCRCVRV